MVWGLTEDTLGIFLAAFEYFGPYSASIFVNISGHGFSELTRVLKQLFL